MARWTENPKAKVRLLPSPQKENLQQNLSSILSLLKGITNVFRKNAHVGEWLSQRSAKPSNRWFESSHVLQNFKSMTEEVKQYLWTEFKFNNLPKYYKYFDTWIENLTENQILYYIAYSKGKKSPYAN